MLSNFASCESKAGAESHYTYLADYNQSSRPVWGYIKAVAALMKAWQVTLTLKLKCIAPFVNAWKHALRWVRSVENVERPDDFRPFGLVSACV